MSNPAEKHPEAGHSASLVMTWYQVTLSAIWDAVLTTDPKGRLTYMNPVAESLTGWVAKEAHGQPLEDLFRIVSEKTRQAVEQPVRRAIESGLVRGRPEAAYFNHYLVKPINIDTLLSFVGRPKVDS